MRAHYNDSDLFELYTDYVEGLVNSDTRQAIEARMREDTPTRQIIEGLRYLFRRHGGNRDAVEAYFEASGKSIEQLVNQAQARRVFQKRMYYAIAATVLLLVIGGALYWQFSSNRLERTVNKALAEAYPMPAQLRGSTPIEESWHQARAAYQMKHYEGAMEALDQILATQPANTQAQFFQGICHIMVEAPNLQQAKLNFRKVLLSESRFTQQAEWYLTLVHLYEADVPSALPLLNKIAGNAEHYRQADAQALLKLLR